MMLTPMNMAAYLISEDVYRDGAPGLYTGYGNSSHGPAHKSSEAPLEDLDPDQKVDLISATDLHVDLQASTSQLRPKRKKMQVDRFGKPTRWESVNEFEEATSSSSRLPSLEDTETIDTSCREPESISAPHIPAPSSMEPAQGIPISSYDSLFNADDPLSDPDGEYTEVTDHSPSQSPKKSNVEGRRRAPKSAAASLSATINRPKRVSSQSLAKLNVRYQTYRDQEYIIQWKWCHSITNVPLQSCRHCISKLSGDSCRFFRFRGIPIMRDGNDIEFLQPPEYLPILLDDVSQAEAAQLPDHFDLNRPMDKAARQDIMSVAASSLIDIFREGLQHATLSNCVRRSRELQIRAMCDYCSTGLFVASYMCQRCGHEYCLDCKKLLEDASIAERDSRQLAYCVKDKFAVGAPRRHVHSAGMLIPISRFSIGELQAVINDMERTINDAREALPMSRDTAQQSAADSKSSTGLSAKLSLSVGSLPSVKMEFLEGELIDDPHPIVLPTHPLAMHSKTTMTEVQFLATWSKGEPILVTDVATSKEWNPQAFITSYGDMQCEIVRSDEHPQVTSAAQVAAKKKADPNYFKTWNKVVKVGDFFETFGKSMEERVDIFGKGIWKLKDWPPAAEFSTSFPDIYKDFNFAVPMPDYTRRDGCRNIYALFPKNANGPDLGPKMYNAWAGEHSKGKKGTTCLHMDVADAVNIMLYTSDSGEAPAAQWDIFRAQDAGAIREFLIERYPTTLNHGDPIHAQVHFLDDDALRELYQSKQVYSWRIRQQKGQAVFIPAGCAHQVCNLTDCIKVAVDFISPQNVSRCFQLTEEFRGMTVEGRKSWKEDVLQLRAQLWYAWLACQAMPVEPSLEEHQLQKRKREAIEVRMAAEEARKEAARETKRIIGGLQQEVYIPRPTASGRGARKSQDVEMKQEPEDIGMIASAASSSSTSKRKRETAPRPPSHMKRKAPSKKVKKETPPRFSVEISSDEEADLRKLVTSSGDAGRKVASNIGRPKRNGKKPCRGCYDTHSTEWRLGPTGSSTLCLTCGARWAAEMRRRGKDPKEVARLGEEKQRLKRERRLAGHFSSTDDDMTERDGLRGGEPEVQVLMETEAPIPVIRNISVTRAVAPLVFKADASTETDAFARSEPNPTENKAVNTTPLRDGEADDDEDPFEKIAVEVSKMARPLTEWQSIRAGQLAAQLQLLSNVEQAHGLDIRTPPPRDGHTLSISSLTS